jgi:hypothetical protein
MSQISSASIVSLLEKTAILESRMREYQARALSAETENKRLRSDLKDSTYISKRLLAERHLGTSV